MTIEKENLIFAVFLLMMNVFVFSLAVFALLGRVLAALMPFGLLLLLRRKDIHTHLRSWIARLFDEGHMHKIPYYSKHRLRDHLTVLSKVSTPCALDVSFGFSQDTKLCYVHDGRVEALIPPETEDMDSPYDVFTLGHLRLPEMERVHTSYLTRFLIWLTTGFTMGNRTHFVFPLNGHPEGSAHEHLAFLNDLDNFVQS